jgi:ubiquinone/menaquinone biosynthesis C-methylase UbiE
MNEQANVARHYSHGRLLEAIVAGLHAIGKSPESITIEDLAPVDEFHIGGRQASEDFVGRLGLSADHHVLDIGCGLGGTSRFVAKTCGCRVTGIDLTPEFVETGQTLCRWVGLSDRIDLCLASALDMPFEARTFDAVLMLHVGMNIVDKARLFAEVHRVLQPDGVFGVYDIMRTNDESLAYPVPWATVEGTCALARPEEYRAALSQSGFEIATERNCRGFATAFFDAARKRAEAEGGPPPLGVHVLMGEDALVKIRNMVESVAAGRIAPIEIIARKR